MGTALAAVYSYFMLGITYGINDASWANTPQQWIVYGGLTSIWAAFCIANIARYPAWAYLWIVGGFTVPLVTFEPMALQTAPWSAVGFRLVNVMCGVVIVWFVSVVVFPLSAFRIAKANYAATVGSMATFVKLLPEQVSTGTTLCQGLQNITQIRTCSILSEFIIRYCSLSLCTCSLSPNRFLGQLLRHLILSRNSQQTSLTDLCQGPNQWAQRAISGPSSPRPFRRQH